MAVSYVGIDTQGARALGQVLRETAGRVDGVRRSVSAALDLADLASQVPAQLAQVQDGFTTLAAGVTDKAALAEQYVMDPRATAARVGAPVDALGAAISGLLGFAGPADLRQVLVGLPAPGVDPALDAALARLNPVLLPAFQTGQRPELTEAQAADLKLLALALGIEHAGPPRAPVEQVDAGARGGFFGQLRFQLKERERTGTEVFWNDFWTGGRTVDKVLADPALLLEWVAGTFELDRRLALAAGLPSLTDVLSSVDFATKGSDPGELATILAAAETEFAAIADWLPAFLVGVDRTAPDATQLAQTLAFAAQVGWPDPGSAAASEQDRFADAIAFLRANRALQSALLPTGFEGDGAPLAFFNEPGIGFVLDLGLRTGVLDAAVLNTITSTVDQALAALGVDMSGPTPVTLTEQLQQQLFALLSTQIPRSALESPAIQAQFIAALGYLRAAGTGPEQRQRLIDVLAAFRTLVVTSAPALTERQLVAAVGQRVLDVLGRSRLRLRSQAAFRKNPEFLLVARQWGVPGSRREEIGKYKFSWSFNDLGELTGIRRKKKSWLSRAWDTVKAIGQAIWKSWEDNPFKAILQIGKIALGAAAFFVPGLQGLGAAAFALSAGEAVFKAAEGDWLGAISAGLSAFTAGASDVFSPVAATGLDALQHDFVKVLFDATTQVSPTLELLKNVKRVFDIGTTIFNFTQADTLIAKIATGLGAGVTALGSGAQLLQNASLISKEFATQLAQVGVSVADVARFVTPTAGLLDALDKNNVLAAFGNGLSILSAGARVVSNPTGAFVDPQAPLNLPPAPFSGVFGFDRETQQALFIFSQHTGAVAGVAKAIDAANRGDMFAAGTFLAQAVQSLNDPVLKNKDEIAIFNQAKVAERIAELGILFQAVFDRKAPAAAVAPLVLARLQAVIDAANPAVPKPKGDKPTSTPAAQPARPAGAATSADPANGNPFFRFNPSTGLIELRPAGDQPASPAAPEGQPVSPQVRTGSGLLRPEGSSFPGPQQSLWRSTDSFFPEGPPTFQPPPEAPGPFRAPGTQAAMDQAVTLAAAPIPRTEQDQPLDGLMSLGRGVDQSAFVTEAEATAQITPFDESIPGFTTTVAFAAAGDAQRASDGSANLTDVIVPLVAAVDPDNEVFTAGAIASTTAGTQTPFVPVADLVAPSPPDVARLTASTASNDSSSSIWRFLSLIGSAIVPSAAAEEVDRTTPPEAIRAVPREEPLDPSRLPIPIAGSTRSPEPIAPFTFEAPTSPERIRISDKVEPPSILGPFPRLDGVVVDPNPGFSLPLIDWSDNGVDLSKLDLSNIALPALTRNTLGLGGRYYNVFGGGASGIIDLETGELLQIGLEAGVGSALGIFGQLGEQPVPRPVAGLELRLTWPRATGLSTGPNEIWAGPQFYARLSTEELVVAMNSWVALGRPPQVPWFLGTPDWGMRISWTDGFQWLNPLDSAVMQQPTAGWVPISTNIIRGFVLLPRGQGEEAPPPGRATLMEQYSGELRDLEERRIQERWDEMWRNWQEQLDQPLQPETPRLDRRSDVVPEQQPVQIASIPGVTVYEGGSAYNDMFSNDFLNQTAGYTGSDPTLFNSSQYTAIDPTLFNAGSEYAAIDPTLFNSSQYAAMDPTLFNAGSEYAGHEQSTFDFPVYG